jgi:hypothetical protein
MKNGQPKKILMNHQETNEDEQYSFSEFYVSTYSDLTEKFNFKYERKFDSIRDIKVKKCE